MTHWTFEIFIDGGCSLCRREASWLRRLDRGRGRLRLTDIADPGFDAAAHGIDPVDAMRTIHGRWRDGRVVTGVEVFRAAYSTVGLGWLWAPTGWPILKPLVDAAYRRFARIRLRRRLRRDGAICWNGVCPTTPEQSRA